MCLKCWLTGIIIVLVVLIAITIGVFSFNLSALPQPGRFETAMAAKAKNWYIERGARTVAPAPRNMVVDEAVGAALFGMDCAQCHGPEGRKPSPIGLAMYPRPADLGSAAVQGLSDRELFWVIQHGIRLSGMPGFAQIDTDAQIWQMVFFVRSTAHPQKRAALTH